jgi:hypothetical protein
VKVGNAREWVNKFFNINSIGIGKLINFNVSRKQHEGWSIREI